MACLTSGHKSRKKKYNKNIIIKGNTQIKVIPLIPHYQFKNKKNKLSNHTDTCTCGVL